MEQKALARWLKVILAGVGLGGLVVLLWVLPAMGRDLVEDYPELAFQYWVWLLFLWAAGLVCYAALYFAWRIAGNIGADRSFSPENVRYLKWISWLAAGDSAFFFAGNVALLFADMNHPGVLLLSLAVVFAGVSVSVAAAGLSHLTRKAAALQEQSDLTI